MSELVPNALHAELRALIASSRQRLAGTVNAELTRLYWNVGQLGQQLTQEFGRGFESRNLRRMVKFAESFPDAAIVSTLSTQLSWSHMVTIVVLKTPQAQQVELLQMHEDGVTVAKYWTELPLKAELEQKLHAALLEARERLARRGVLLEGGR